LESERQAAVEAYCKACTVSHNNQRTNRQQSPRSFSECICFQRRRLRRRYHHSLSCYWSHQFLKKH